MTRYETALKAYEEKFGELDNVKFLLGGSAPMSPEEYLDSFTLILEGIADGSIPVVDGYNDASLASAKIEISQ